MAIQKVALANKPQYSITSVDHALRLIQMLRDHGEVRVTGAAAELGVSPSTVHRLLSMLVYRGFAVQSESRIYYPGPALNAAPTRRPWMKTLIETCRPHLSLMAAELQETANLSIRVGTKIRVIDIAESINTLPVSHQVGLILDANRAAAGKALLAEVGPATLERLYRSKAAEFNGDFLSDNKYHELIGQLRRVRLNGYAMNAEETNFGLHALGMPIRAADGAPIAAVGVSAPLARAWRLSRPEFITIMRSMCAEIEAAVTNAVMPMDPAIAV